MPLLMCPSILSSCPASPSCFPVDHADADREQCAARVPAGWGDSWLLDRRGWWRGRGELARGWGKRGYRWRGSGCVWAWSGVPGALSAPLGCPPVVSSSEGPPGLLNVRARGSPQPHSPRSPSPGLPGSPPAAPRHTQCKLELPCPLLLSTFQWLVAFFSLTAAC